MSKRGDIHVDWIISMGLFLISTIAMFLFFRPTDVPPVSKEVLLDTLIFHFNENFTWVVKTTPVFVQTCKPYVPKGGSGDGIMMIGITLDPSISWDLGTVTYQSGDVSRSWDRFEDIECPPGGQNLDNEEFLITSTSPATFTYLYFPSAPYPPKPLFTADCNPAKIDNEDIKDYCDFFVGSGEDFEGLNTGSLEDFTSIPPNEYFQLSNIKANWNFPERNEFWILACNSDTNCDPFGEGDSGDYLINYKTGSTYQQADIVTREIKTFTINTKGEKEPVTILFQVW